MATDNSFFKSLYLSVTTKTFTAYNFYLRIFSKKETDNSISVVSHKTIENGFFFLRPNMAGVPVEGTLTTLSSQCQIFNGNQKNSVPDANTGPT